MEKQLEILYKGFVEIDGKKPKQYIKDETKFYSYSHVRQRFESYGGVLKDNVVMVDVDSMTEAEMLLNIINNLNIQCNVLKTTNGMHFYFQNSELQTNKIKRKTALGITVDIKLGSKNTVDPLRIKGERRLWLRSSDSMAVIPKYLVPLSGEVPDFSGLTDGDGRNQTLFNYILTLQAEGFVKAEIKEAVKIINSFIIADPLPSDEIDTILRDEAFLKPVFFVKNTFLHHEFAKYLRDNEHVIKINDVLHVYKEGIYLDDITEIESVMIKHIPQLNKGKRGEVMAYLNIICEEKELSDCTYITIVNGLYDLSTGKQLEYNPNYIVKNKLPYSYNQSAYDKTVDDALNKICINNLQLRSLLEEVIGYQLLRRNELGKFFILTGGGSNGKSTFLIMIKKFLGPGNFSSLALEEIGQRFKTAEMYGKLSNIGDDISNQYISDNAILKKLITGETVNVERKGQDPFEFNNYAKLIFSANDIPRINDTSDGLMRRLVIVPFKAKFKSSDEDFDPFIIDKLLTNNAMEYLLNLGIEGLRRVLRNNGFTEVPEVVEAISEYEKINNPMIMFVNENNVLNQSTNEVYLRYSTWCQQNGLKSLSKYIFIRDVCRKFDFKSKQMRVDGEKIYVLVNK